ncbi:MAG: folate-binding protein [Brachymonas sp.]|nr:folate-binding protein [Brachymonas sp.]
MNHASIPFTDAPAATPVDSGFASHGVIALLGPQASPRSNWGLVRVRGADATSFLHKQLTQDVNRMGPKDARLAAWCNAKGRMLASFVLLREQGAQDAADEPSYLLLCRRDVMAGFMQKLKMYVLRSKVVIEDASASMSVYGLLGDAALAAWQAHGQQPPAAPWQCLSVQENAQRRYLLSLYPATVDAATLESTSLPRTVCLQMPGLPAPDGPALPLWQWEWSEAASGVPGIEQACSGLFVPQMINFESVGGVNFQKGCYPGQEVVARSQFRGAIKRRGQIAAAQATGLAAGDEVWFCPLASGDSSSPAQSAGATIEGANTPPEAEPCGTLVQVAQTAPASDASTAHSLVFASLQNSSVEAALASQGQLRVGHAQGPVLQLHPLPYPLIEV